MSEPSNFDRSVNHSFNKVLLPSATSETEVTADQPLLKDTITFRRNVRTVSPSCSIPSTKMNTTTDEDEERKEITCRMSNLIVAPSAGQEDESYRSTTPIPLLPRHQSHMTELSPATLNRLRSYAATKQGSGVGAGSAYNSITNSPCVTEVTEIVSNTTSFNQNLVLPLFGAGGCPNRDSPSTSQVSVGSVPPTLTAALLPSMRHHYDLTPITRNTSVGTPTDELNCASNSSDRKCNNANRHITITPSEDREYDLDDGVLLHGEHLTMPSDTLLSSNEECLGIMQPSFSLVGRNIENKLDLEKEGIVVPPDLPLAFEFPTRKYYSFTSRRQYDDDQLCSDANYPGSTLKPYQPNQRKEEFDIEPLPEEELQRIFIARRYNRPAEVTTNAVNREVDPMLVIEEADKNHRLLHNSIPLDDYSRHWSIPSLQMAHQLQGSIASLTDATELEDEDSLVYIYPNNENAATEAYVTAGIEDAYDDLSISSRGSNLCNFDDFGDRAAFRNPSNSENLTQPQFHHPFSIPSDVYSDDTDSIEAVAMGAEDVGLESENRILPPDTTARHRKRKQQRLKEACDWLQSVEVDQNVFAEAASSKFLTAGNNIPDEVHYPQQFLHHQLRKPFLTQEIPMQRQISSPAHLSSFHRNSAKTGIDC